MRTDQAPHPEPDLRSDPGSDLQMASAAARWQFWIDRRGAITDIVGCRPDGSLVTAKLLSEHPEQYADAAVAGNVEASYHSVRQWLCAAAA